MEGGGDELGPAPVPSVGGGSAGVGGACRIAGSRRGCLKRLQKEYHALCKELLLQIVARPLPNDILEWLQPESWNPMWSATR
nr:uncharacterized protein LOC117842092 isoform X4 [Setaria viridis]